MKWLLLWLQEVQGCWWFVACLQQEIIRTVTGGGGSYKNAHHHLHALLLTFIFLSLLSLWCSCAGFLKTWLPFLMLMGIILTVALTLNLRWPGRQVEDTVEPLQVGWEVDHLDNKGCIARCRAKVTEEIKTFLLQAEIVEREGPTHVHQHMPGLWKAGGLLLAIVQWWSWNAQRCKFIYIQSFALREVTEHSPTTTTTRTTQTHLMDYDYWKPSSRFKPLAPAKCRSWVAVLIVEVCTLLDSLRKAHPCLAFRFWWPYIVMDWECNPMFPCFQKVIFILERTNMLNQLDAFLGNLLHFMLDLM